MHYILVINTGSTSTKLAVFHGGEKLLDENINHPVEGLAECKTLLDQSPLRVEGRSARQRVGRTSWRRTCSRPAATL